MSEAPQKEMTLNDLVAFFTGLRNRCVTRHGDVSPETIVILTPEDVAGLDRMTKFLSLAAGHANAINALIFGRRR